MNRKIVAGMRIILGLALLVFGLNGFLQFMPMMEMPEAAGAFMGALMASGYMMVIVNVLKIVIGLLLLINKYTPLALVLLVPLSINFVAFHLFLDIANIIPGLIVFILNVVLLFVNLDRYHGMLQVR